MSALWEEDESEECSTGVSSTEPSRSTTPIPETPPHSLPSSPLGKGPALLVQPDVQEESTPSESTHSESTPDARLQKYARGQRRSLPTASPLFRPGESSDAHLPTHALPNPTQPSSTAPASNGYTGLTLPHAGYSNDKGKATAEGRVDLVRAGVAQSSMVTIEVIRGVAATVSNGTAPADIPMKRRKNSFSFSLGRSFSLALKSKKRESATPTHLQGSLPLPVAFTAHVAPPSYVPESHVLVQVHAVGLETLDSLIVHEKSGMGTSGGGGGKGIGGGKAGFIPGRSFVGKVIECGWAVREEVCRRGEWVVGLLDVKKVRYFDLYLILSVCRYGMAMHLRFCGEDFELTEPFLLLAVRRTRRVHPCGAPSCPSSTSASVTERVAVSAPPTDAYTQSIVAGKRSRPTLLFLTPRANSAVHRGACTFAALWSTRTSRYTVVRRRASAATRQQTPQFGK